MATDGSSIHEKARALWSALVTNRRVPRSLQYLDFEEQDNDPTHVANRVYARDGINVMHSLGPVNQLGRENWIDVVNKSGDTIYNGTPVAITEGGGAQRIAVACYPNTDIRSLFTLGLATHDIEDNQNGVVTWFGLVRDLDTSAFTVNDALYLGPTAGQFQVGPPDWRKCRIFLGFVLVAHPQQGVIGCSVKNHRPRAFEANADPYYASNRAHAERIGEWGYDTNVDKMIVYNGTAWVNVDGTAL